jgi:hypothetical protein
MSLLGRRVRRAALAVALIATACVPLLLAAGPLMGGQADALEGGTVERLGSAARGAAAEVGRALERIERIDARREERRAERFPAVRYRSSRALGLPFADGRLVRGVRVPHEGRHFFTWDTIQREAPNRGWRRHGTDRLVRTTLRVAREHRNAHPGAPRLAIGDLSRPEGGDFGPEYGALGHASHQNGLDVDIYYPRRDGRERAPRSVDQVNLRLAQDLVDRFVEAGAEKVFVGPSTPLDGPPDVVQAAPHHDDHMHVRLPQAGG